MRDRLYAGLPSPAPEAQAASALLVDLIRAEIDAAGGVIPFTRYMDLALYAPGLGYYSAGLAKLGRDGDFITAPEMSALYGRCIARCIAPLLAELAPADLLELGAGSAALAIDLLSELQAIGALPERYLILETSAGLRARQRERIATILPALRDRVVWIDTLPQGMRGIVLANEVLDALPVERFEARRDRIDALQVAATPEGFDWSPEPAGTALREAVAEIEAALGETFQPGYRSEASLQIAPLVASLADALDRGALLFGDYGYARREYYHPERRDGTLVCHYRHRAHGDPFALVGLQDISASVDFSAVAAAGRAAGLRLAGYTSQAHFLLDCGMLDLLGQAVARDPDAYLQQAQQAKRLLLPGEMGERFKMIALAKNLAVEVPGFAGRDLSARL